MIYYYCFSVLNTEHQLNVIILYQSIFQFRTINWYSRTTFVSYMYVRFLLNAKTRVILRLFQYSYYRRVVFEHAEFFDQIHGTSAYYRLGFVGVLKEFSSRIKQKFESGPGLRPTDHYNIHICMRVYDAYGNNMLYARRFSSLHAVYTRVEQN